jgi:hypothetical protein
VTAQPERGCAFFEREPGADDTWCPIVDAGASLSELIDARRNARAGCC